MGCGIRRSGLEGRNISAFRYGNDAGLVFTFGRKVLFQAFAKFTRFYTDDRVVIRTKVVSPVEHNFSDTLLPQLFMTAVQAVLADIEEQIPQSRRSLKECAIGDAFDRSPAGVANGILRHQAAGSLPDKHLPARFFRMNRPKSDPAQNEFYRKRDERST